MDHRSLVYAFGPLRLDTARRLLVAGSRVSSLPEKAFRILMLLAESNGQLVEREMLIDVLWPDEDVGENNLTQHIYLLRGVLEGHGGRRSYIKTEAKRGYRFTVPVAAIDNSVDYFSPRIAAALGSIGREQLDTFRRYCEGCYQLEKRTRESLSAAASRFDEVVELDPMHWQAYLGIARAYAFLGAYLFEPNTAVFPRARAAVLKALEIHPSATGHALLAEILMFGEWDWRGAEIAMQTALALEPESALVHNHAAWFALGSGDLDRAFYEARAALEIEPASLFYRNVLARVLIHRGDYGSAISMLLRVLELDPAIDAATENLALAYMVDGEPKLAIELIRKRGSRGALNDHMIGQLGRALAEAGLTTEAERIYFDVLGSASERYVPAWPIGLVAAALDRLDEAREHLTRAAREREPAVVFLKSLPLFDKLSGFDEFARILKAVGPART